MGIPETEEPMSATPCCAPRFRASPPMTPPTRVWDAHMHVHVIPDHPWDSPPERALALMDAVGIERAVIMPYTEIGRNNADQLEIDAAYSAASPGRFLLFARLDPTDDGFAVELLERAVTELGYVGLKLHPVGSGVAPADPRTVRLVRKAAELGLPTLFHCGDEALTTPDEIGPLADKVPEAPILLGHAGGYFGAPRALAWARRCENLHLEISATPDLPHLREAMDTLGPRRLLFGSDGPGCLPWLELRKALLLLSHGFTADTDLLLRENLRRLLTRLPEAAAGEGA